MTRMVRKHFVSCKRFWQAACCASVLLLAHQPLMAAVIVVDGSTCTLVDAITAANADAATGGCAAGSGSDELQLTASVLLTSMNVNYSGPTGLPVIISHITIEGNDLVVERDPAAPAFRIFAVDDVGTLNLRRLTVRNGSVGAANGGGIYNRGALTLKNSAVSFNNADFDGGGIYNAAGITNVRRSTVSGNLAVSFGGGIYNFSGSVFVMRSAISENDGDFAGGGIWNEDQLVVFRSLVSENFCHDQGGGIVNFGTATLTDSTVRGNMAADSGGVANHDTLSVTNSTLSGNEFQGLGNFGTATVTNTTVSGNGIGSAFSQILNFSFPADTLTLTNSIVGHSASGMNCSGTITDGGGNLADDATCGTVPATLSGLDPVLTNNGGSTFTHALLAGSSAIDAAGACGLVTDQRSFVRDDGACDSGAFEFGALPPIRGAFSGLEAAQGICRNETTAQEILVPLGGAKAWNCTRAGLVVSSGDEVTLSVTGDRP